MSRGDAASPLWEKVQLRRSVLQLAMCKHWHLVAICCTARPNFRSHHSLCFYPLFSDDSLLSPSFSLLLSSPSYFDLFLLPLPVLPFFLFSRSNPRPLFPFLSSSPSTLTTFLSSYSFFFVLNHSLLFSLPTSSFSHLLLSISLCSSLNSFLSFFLLPMPFTFLLLPPSSLTLSSILYSSLLLFPARSFFSPSTFLLLSVFVSLVCLSVSQRGGRWWHRPSVLLPRLRVQ